MHPFSFFIPKSKLLYIWAAKKLRKYHKRQIFGSSQNTIILKEKRNKKFADTRY